MSNIAPKSLHFKKILVRLVGWVVGWLIGWLIGWLVERGSPYVALAVFEITM